MREREVTRTVPQRLRAEGLVGLKLRYKNDRGPDIEGDLPRSRRKLFIEAKGERAGADPWGEGANCRMAMGEALLQVLSVYDQDVVCGIAVPYTKEFQKVLQHLAGHSEAWAARFAGARGRGLASWAARHGLLPGEIRIAHRDS